MNSKQRNRARIVLLAIIVASCYLAIVLYSTQLIHGSEYTAKADKQYVKPPVSIFDRGSIFFEAKDGTKVSVASISDGYTVYMNPKLLSDPNLAFDAISHYIKTDKNEFLAKSSKIGDPYEELLRKVDTESAESIKSLKLPGIGVAKESWRSYPGAGLASHVIGLVGQNANSNIEGRYGLERTYQSVLNRTGSEDSNIFAQLFSGIKESVFGENKQEGSIVTTIEPTVEKYLEKTLLQTSNLWHPDEIGGIIIDPQTGKIAAMASLPTFDPNDVSDIKNLSVFSNPLVEHVYEMGSILKPLTMATGLDSGAITPKSTYDDTGTLTLSGKKISNFDGKARGVVNVQEVLSQSLNVGAATIGLKVGKENFQKYFKSFGIGDKSGIDQPNEATGIIRNLETGRDIEVATAAYGQGIAISPIAMVRALSILGNNGYLVKPYLVKEIDYTDGTNKMIEPEKTGPFLKKETTTEVTRMLVKVVDEALRKGALKMEHYTIAAKTGTAQIPDPTNKGYYTDRYLHSFFGYFPAYDPKFIVFLYQIHPKGAQYASETLADPFSEIAKFLIDYYSIAPDR